MTCPSYSWKCDTRCVFICQERGNEQFGEWSESPLELCNWCGSKILPLPYAPHECRDMDLYEPSIWEEA